MTAQSPLGRPNHHQLDKASIPHSTAENGAVSVSWTGSRDANGGAV
jgi:hypothetical protein